MDNFYDASQGVTEHTGFPNPATDSYMVSLDITNELVKHPASTFFMEIAGNNWEQMGIFAGDIAIIDRALEPRKTDTIICWQADSFIMKKLPHVPRGTTIWGVVTNIVHKLRS